MKSTLNIVFAAVVLASGLEFAAMGQSTAFSYQGRLTAGGSPANGSYDLQFLLYDRAVGGSQQGPILTNTATAISNGLFTVTLDFGPVFPGADRWLDIAVRTNGGGTFAELTPRQPLQPAPYAIMAQSASNLLGVVPSAQLSGSYPGVVTFGNPANNFDGHYSGDGSGLGSLNASNLAAGVVPDGRLAGNIARTNQVWLIGGNAGTTDNFVGTVDNTSFNIRVSNDRVVSYRSGVVPGGFSNAPSVIAGSSVNSALTTIVGATIAGGGGSYGGAGFPNQVSADYGTIGGGIGNIASGDYATVAGGGGAYGYGNVASGYESAVGGGDYNRATGNNATVCGGYGSLASGASATVAGGSGNTAGGTCSFAGGFYANAKHDGSFVWADTNGFSFASTTASQFRVRCTGGAAFVTAIDSSGSATAGVRVLSGDTAWSSISDKNAKKNFQPVDGEAILDRLAAIPVETWNYKWEADTDTPHIGPMAQDFKGAFYPGRDDKSISTLEFDGVELAAIQGLNKRLVAQAAQMREKDAEIQELKSRMAELQRLVQRLAAQRGN